MIENIKYIFMAYGTLILVMFIAFGIAYNKLNLGAKSKAQTGEKSESRSIDIE